MAATVSKNNPANKGKSGNKMVTSSDCEACKNKCNKGKNYLEVFSKRGMGNGVACENKN